MNREVSARLASQALREQNATSMQHFNQATMPAYVCAGVISAGDYAFNLDKRELHKCADDTYAHDYAILSRHLARCRKCQREVSLCDVMLWSDKGHTTAKRQELNAYHTFTNMD